LPRIALRLLVLLAVAAPLPRAHAEAAPCGARGWPWVRLANDALPAPFDAAFRALLVAQLGAGLESRHIELCAASEGQPADMTAGAASEIALSASEGDIVTVAVRDAITGKRLARELALASVPRDARPLTVALAVDELLRASWIELELPDAPAPTRPVPPEIGALVAGAAPTSAERHRWELGAELAAERFGGGTTQAGVDLVARGAPMPPLSLLTLHVALGLRRGAAVHAADGDVRSTGIEADVSVEIALPPRARRWELALGLGGRLLHASLSGQPRAAARGADATATAIYLGAGLRGSVRLTRAFGLSLAGGLGVPLRAVDVLDGDTRVAGLSGPMLSLALGGWWRFP
jgi:hypothetical protein